MIYRIVGSTAAPGGDISGAFAPPSSASDNPLLQTMARASDQMERLRTQVDQWMASTRARMADASQARQWIATLDRMHRRLVRDGALEPLPDALRDFAVRQGLLSSSQASSGFDASSVRSLKTSLTSMVSGASESSTVEQIELRQFLSSYENALTLNNAVIAKLRDIMGKIVASL